MPEEQGYEQYRNLRHGKSISESRPCPTATLPGSGSTTGEPFNQFGFLFVFFPRVDSKFIWTVNSNYFSFFSFLFQMW